MSSVLTLNGGVLVSNGVAVSHEGGSSVNIQEDKSYTVSASGNQTISPDTGYDAMEAVALSVPSGTATAPTSISGTSASVSTGTNTLTLSKTVSVTPNISTAGYISSGTAGNSSVSLTASVTTKAAATITPTTSNQTIASGTYLTGTQTIAGDANLLASNIKKNVTIFNTTGTYEGSGGGTPTLKMGVIRPDAELVQTWSDDYLVNADKGVTIPAYSTTATTLVNAAVQSTTATLTNDSYRYYVLERFLTIPQYSVTTKAKGRQEYAYESVLYEIVNIPASTFKAILDNTSYATRNVAVFVAGNQIRDLYWSSGTALAVYTATTYGVAQVLTAPSISSASAASPTLTVTAPSCTIRGSTTYLVNTYYNAITDIRCQWIIELYRVPLSTTSTYGIDGWGVSSQAHHIISCAQSSTHKLT